MARKMSGLQKEKNPATMGGLMEKAQAAPKSGKNRMKSEELFNMIQKRAYELYLARNGIYEDPEKDWLEAEKEIKTLYQETT